MPFTKSTSDHAPAAQAIAPSAPSAAALLISLPPQSSDALHTTLANLTLAFPHRNLLLATPADSPAPPQLATTTLRLLTYPPAATSTIELVVPPSRFIETHSLAQQHQAANCLLLGPGAEALPPTLLRNLASDTADLILPQYHLGAREGLVNSAILYPVTRALYGTRPRFPLAVDLGLSLRMAERLANTAQRYLASGQQEAILWPVAEAAAANFLIAEVDGCPRQLPQPASLDLNALLAHVVGSLFADIDAKATYWQRARPAQPPQPLRETPNATPGIPDVTPMLEAFRIAYINLADIWSLVLPPNSLLGLKRLSQMPPTAFHMSDTLWTRIVYDFALAFRIRTIHRGHLLGALTPLYLAWVASHILLTDAGTTVEQHISDLAATFERDKPYLVSRWRWPDRFNP